MATGCFYVCLMAVAVTVSFCSAEHPSVSFPSFVSVDYDSEINLTCTASGYPKPQSRIEALNVSIPASHNGKATKIGHHMYQVASQLVVEPRRHQLQPGSDFRARCEVWLGRHRHGHHHHMGAKTTTAGGMLASEEARTVLYATIHINALPGSPSVFEADAPAELVPRLPAPRGPVPPAINVSHVVPAPYNTRADPLLESINKTDRLASQSESLLRIGDSAVQPAALVHNASMTNGGHPQPEVPSPLSPSNILLADELPTPRSPASQSESLLRIGDSAVQPAAPVHEAIMTNGGHPQPEVPAPLSPSKILLADEIPTPSRPASQSESLLRIGDSPVQPASPVHDASFTNGGHSQPGVPAPLSPSSILLADEMPRPSSDAHNIAAIGISAAGKSQPPAGRPYCSSLAAMPHISFNGILESSTGVRVSVRCSRGYSEKDSRKIDIVTCSNVHRVWSRLPNCTDINECDDGSANCPTRTICSNTQGSYLCVCSNGYAGNRSDCVRRNISMSFPPLAHKGSAVRTPVGVGIGGAIFVGIVVCVLLVTFRRKDSPFTPRKVATYKGGTVTARSLSPTSPGAGGRKKLKPIMSYDGEMTDTELADAIRSLPVFSKTQSIPRVRSLDLTSGCGRRKAFAMPKPISSMPGMSISGDRHTTSPVEECGSLDWSSARPSKDDVMSGVVEERMMATASKSMTDIQNRLMTPPQRDFVPLALSPADSEEDILLVGSLQTLPRSEFVTQNLWPHDSSA